MGILDRISTLIKSNLNAAVDKMADPGKEIEQLIVEMEDNQRKARAEVQAIMATEKRQRQRATALEKSSLEWVERAERALHAGDEGLAREALKRKVEIDAELADALKALASDGEHVSRLTEALKALGERVKEVKLRKETLKSQARAQKSREHGTGPTSAFDRFDELSTGVDVREAEVLLDDELAEASHTDGKSREVERKLEELSKNQDIEDKLAALKEKMKK